MTIDQTSTGGSTYVLGHVDTEIQRLILQGRLHNDFTEHALPASGAGHGGRIRRGQSCP